MGNELDPAPPARSARPHFIAPRWLRALVRFMDDAIGIPGTKLRVGLDSLLGLALPGAGDAVSTFSHVALIWSAFRGGVPRPVFARLLLNAAIDAGVGAIPLLGDLFDVGFKANRRNLELIERVERDVARKATFGDYAFITCVILAAILILLAPALIVAWVIAAVLRSA